MRFAKLEKGKLLLENDGLKSGVYLVVSGPIKDPNNSIFSSYYILGRCNVDGKQYTEHKVWPGHVKEFQEVFDERRKDMILKAKFLHAL